MESTRAIFLSYASEDAAAALRLCADLRAAGFEVWFDQSELRGGDAWDASIRRQIKSCALFLPLISQSTQARAEGYFRLEWKLAVDRSHLMAAEKAFLMPVVIDATANAEALVPDRFRELQWTRLPGGAASAAFLDSVRRLLDPATATAPHPQDSAPAAAARDRGPAGLSRVLILTGVGLLACALAVAVGMRFFGAAKDSRGDARSSPATNAADGFSPPAHSLAVLPFVNMSSDKEQEYFSDGLTEELLNSLAKVRDLQVAARTSSFSFKNEKVDLADVGRKLNVGAILEGSVRKEGTQVRITAQLINAVSGFHLWSETYDRDLHNILALQTEIATAVTGALQATLLPGTTAAIELGGTQNPAAFDAYLRGRNLERAAYTKEHLLARIDAYAEAIRLDPAFANAYVGYSLSQTSYHNNFARDNEIDGYRVRARAAADKAIALAPALGEAHAALAFGFERGDLDFAAASREFDRALELSPNNVFILLRAGSFNLLQGRREDGISDLRRALVLDPLNGFAYTTVAGAYETAGLLSESLALLDRALAIDPEDGRAIATRGVIALNEGDFAGAVKDCTSRHPDWLNQLCLALAFDKLGEREKSDAQMAALAADQGDSGAYQFAEIHAQRGEVARALQWLETAYRLRDPGLVSLSIDRWVDPLRREPRFQAIERKLRPSGQGTAG